MLPNEIIDNVVLPPGDDEGERIVSRVSSRLHLWPVQDSHAGRYQCIATNALGSSYSTRALITVNGMCLKYLFHKPQNTSVQTSLNAAVNVS
jgi:hypothetical protein